MAFKEIFRRSEKQTRVSAPCVKKATEMCCQHRAGIFKTLLTNLSDEMECRLPLGRLNIPFPKVIKGRLKIYHIFGIQNDQSKRPCDMCRKSKMCLNQSDSSSAKTLPELFVSPLNSYIGRTGLFPTDN